MQLEVFKNLHLQINYFYFNIKIISPHGKISVNKEEINIS